MSLSESDLAELRQLHPKIIEAKLQKAGANPGAVVPGLGNGMMLRGDVEAWLAQQYKRRSDMAETAGRFLWPVAAAA